MVKDVPGLVDKLASFSGIALDDEEKDKVVEKCSFKHMKSQSQLFDYRLPFNTNPPEADTSTVMKRGTFVNKGKSDSSVQAGFDEDVKKRFQQAIDKELSHPALQKWPLEGGEEALKEFKKFASQAK